MSRYDDDYEDIDGDDYEDDIEDEETDDESPRRSSVNPFSSGIQRSSSGPGGNNPANRFGDSSRLPGSVGSARPGGGSTPPPGGQRPFGSSPGSTSSSGGGSGPRPFGAGGSGSSTGGSGGSSPFSRTTPPGGGGTPPQRPSSFGAGSGSRPPTPPGSSALTKPDDQKEDKSSGGGLGGLGKGLGGLGGRFGGGDKKDDKPATPKSDAGSKGLGGLGGLGGRFGSGGDKKDDKPAAPKSDGGGGLGKGLGALTSRFGSGDKDRKDGKPAAPKEDGGRGGLLGGFGRSGADKPASPTSAASSSSPFGSGPGARPGSPPPPGSSGGSGPAKATSAPKAPRQSLRDRLKNFSLLKKKDTKSTKSRSKTPTVRQGGLSLDTKLDILGVALLLGALAILFSSLSPNQGELTGWINARLAEAFGWGAIAVPIVMLAAGVWLIARHFGEDAPELDTVKLIGVGMLYIGVLVLFQYIDSFSYDLRPGTGYLDQLRNVFLPISYLSGAGGGRVGGELYYLLVSNVTEIGGFFVLFAWMIIGVMLTLSLSAAELAIILISVWRSFSDARQRRAQRRAAMLAEQQALNPGLPQISVSKPAEPLPSGARSPALPAPAAGPPMQEERSIPITQGGRTITAPFRPGDPIPVEASGAAPEPQRTTPSPFAPATAGVRTAEVERADEADETRSGGRLGGFAARMREALPGGKSDTQAMPSGDVPASEKSGEAERGGRLGGFAARMREALPGAKTDDKPADSGDGAKDRAEDKSSAARSFGVGAFAARVRETLPGVSSPAKEKGEEPKPASEANATPTPVPVAQASQPGQTSGIDAGTPAASAVPPTPPNSGELEAAKPNPESPVRLGTLLGRSSDAGALATGTGAGAGRPNLTPPARPSPFGRPPRREENASKTDDVTAKPATAESTIEAEDQATDSASTAPAASRETPQSSGIRPSPFAAPPAREPAKSAHVDEGSDDEDETLDELEKLPPARPKGMGPLPRPQTPSVFNPANRGAPPGRVAPTGTQPGAMKPPEPASRPSFGSLQERMAALRSAGKDGDKDTAKQDEEVTAAAEAAETPTVETPAAMTEETTQAAEVKPEAEATTSATPSRPEPRPAPRIIAMDEDGEDLDLEDDEDEEAEEAPAAVAHRDEMPTLTQPRDLGVRRPAPFSQPPASASRRDTAASHQMPEQPKPPAPPARAVAFSAPSTPPVAGASPPPPPQRSAGRRKDWRMPEYGTLLVSGSDQDLDHDVLLERARIIEETLSSFGAPGRVVEVRTGPVITQFGVEPDYLTGRNGKKIRIKVSAIAQLDKDLQLALGAKSIRIEAPVPGKGYVGIEVPNEQAAVVRLRDVLESQEFKKINSPLAICLGQGVDGTPVAADLSAMPHLLIAGTTGSGKSVCVNTIIASLLVRNTPDRLKFIMVDPKRVELTGYNGIPHLVAPVVVELERIVSVLKWVTREMDERYKKFSSAGARNIEDFNKHLPQGEPIMPYIIVIIDELADLMMLAPDETERVITRIAALARATGIHLVIATQRPSVDVVTGLIKANFPARIAFAVAGSVDSRVILDQPGAERLLGRGDMLYMSGDSPAPVRLQGVYVSDSEISNITRFWRAQMDEDDLAARTPLSAFSMDETARESSASSGWGNRGGALRQPAQQQAFWDRELREGTSSTFSSDDGDDGGDGDDALYDEAVELVRRLNKASVSLLQRRLRIGYTRAARLIDIMEERGVVGPPTEGSKPREVLPAK